MIEISDIRTQLETARQKGILEFEQTDSPQTLYEKRTKYLGKKGEVKAVLRGLGALSPEERPQIGQLANEVADALEAAYQNRLAQLKSSESELRLTKDEVDITLPGTWTRRGAYHPLMRTQYEIEELFYSMGYDIAEGPEIESDYYNFEALNFPPDHPARDMQDTFFTKSGHVLRTHTSPVQIHYMETHKPPLRMIAPGRVYRCDSDITHSPMFTQIEGLVVDKNITFCDLKGTLEFLIHKFFSPDTITRFRPSYFPFTEPSAEVDIAVTDSSGHVTGWLEVLGCGMVNPAVFEAVGYDPERFTGFAFGLGIERFAMLKYGIRDIRLFYENDIRMLKQFR
ncbi:MAG: phenylalanine--tRNA ligase subunit alpha [Candidatus Omnitrophota bacterium]|jgi:phenylalanyl-tRNA synthetase alpha chain|nr:MAG: phenylalanine--tRNA ligase subunit alpha [Candidatus Omnitrophota bacterium]